MPQIDKRQHGGCSEESSCTHHTAEAVRFQRKEEGCYGIDEQSVGSS